MLLIALIMVMSLTACDKNWIPADTTALTADNIVETDVSGTEGGTSVQTQPLPSTTQHTHSYQEEIVAATCSSKGYTAFSCACGNSYIGNETAQLEHSWSDWVTAKEPTEDAVGVAERSCTACPEKESKQLEKLPHSHRYSQVITEATCTAKGYTIFSCACGNSYVGSEVEATGRHTFNEESICSGCGLEPSVGLAFELGADGTYYIVKGIGACADVDVVVPNVYQGLPVTEIGGNAFRDLNQVKSVILPDSIKTVGFYSFANCTGLKSVMLSDRITEIGAGAFEACVNLEQVNIPEGLTEISVYVFAGCENLTDIKLPDTVLSIECGVFAGCSRLTAVVLSKNLQRISEFAFENCSELIEITMPAGVAYLGQEIFKGCGKLKTLCYEGTLEQWKKVTKDTVWSNKDGAVAVQCKDGLVA